MKTTVGDDDRPTLSQQITELQRELKMRNRVYPRQIKSGKLSTNKAYEQTRNMSAALNTLLWLQKNGDAVKAAHEQIKEGV